LPQQKAGTVTAQSTAFLPGRHDTITIVREENGSMDQIKEKLISCFSAVMPELKPEEIPHASAVNASNWDSVTTVTLITVIEDEFQISIELDDLSHFDSFQGILAYLKQGIAQDSVAVDLA
jgi:acyl carrier protein